jgi:cell division transport system permease protein
MRAWLTHHGHSLRLALGRLADAPFAAAFSILVIGVALSLPAGFYVLLQNFQRVAGQAATEPELTVFLKLELGETAARGFAESLRARPDVAGVEFVSREAGLRSLNDSGLADLLAGLPGNPLPHAVTVTPKASNSEALEALAGQLRKRAEVERIALDSDWAKRLTAATRFAETLVWLLAGLLGAALAAITGNTIRLQIYALREEIEVSRLIGATDRFVRRPFLYHGALQGLLGGLAGWGIVEAGRWALAPHVDALAAAYGTQYHMLGLTWLESALMLGATLLLGLLGAYLSVNHALRRIDR